MKRFFFGSIHVHFGLHHCSVAEKNPSVEALCAAAHKEILFSLCHSINFLIYEYIISYFFCKTLMDKEYIYLSKDKLKP